MSKLWRAAPVMFAMGALLSACGNAPTSKSEVPEPKSAKQIDVEKLKSAASSALKSKGKTFSSFGTPFRISARSTAGDTPPEWWTSLQNIDLDADSGVNSGNGSLSFGQNATLRIYIRNFVDQAFYVACKVDGVSETDTDWAIQWGGYFQNNGGIGKQPVNWGPTPQEFWFYTPPLDSAERNPEIELELNRVSPDRPPNYPLKVHFCTVIPFQ